MLGCCLFAVPKSCHIHIAPSRRTRIIQPDHEGDCPVGAGLERPGLAIVSQVSSVRMQSPPSPGRSAERPTALIFANAERLLACEPMRKSLLLLTLAAAWTASSTKSASALELGYRQAKLKNGMTVIVHEDHALPMVATNVIYRVGSADEQPGRTGFAHLFEHLMFMGTRR